MEKFIGKVANEVTVDQKQYQKLADLRLRRQVREERLHEAAYSTKMFLIVVAVILLIGVGYIVNRNFTAPARTTTAYSAIAPSSTVAESKQTQPDEIRARIIVQAQKLMDLDKKGELRPMCPARIGNPLKEMARLARLSNNDEIINYVASVRNYIVETTGDQYYNVEI
jgi:hypothetical protein